MKNYNFSDKDQEKLNVLKYQNKLLNNIEEKFDKTKILADEAIENSEKLLKEFNKIKDLKNNYKDIKVYNKEFNPIKIKSWDELLKEAELNIDSPALITDLLSENEIKNVEEKIEIWNIEFKNIHKFDKVDWAICGVAGILAASIDIFLVGMPKTGLGGSQGGALSNYIREKIETLFTKDEIRKLEKKYWVPYDPADNRNLKIPIDGLSTYFHRYHSLGHDPILGFIFGVLDVMNGTFSAIDKHGNFIIQKVVNQETVGMNFFEAVCRVFGHMKSDISTPMGLPAPLMPLLNFLQFGSIGEEGLTIAEVSRSMYAQGYDFSHFLSMSISPMIIEILVRALYFAKRKYEGNSFNDSIPIDFGVNRKPKLRTMLFTAHLIATAGNAGKIGITQNPLAINYTQWIALFRYLIPQMKWILNDKEKERSKYVNNKLSEEWNIIDRELEQLWAKTISEAIIIK